MSVIMREKRAANRRNDIFAESVVMDTPIQVVAVPKSAEATQLILQSLANNFLFCTIDNSDLDTIAQLMIEKQVAVNEIVITEGDTGDYFYVVESGAFSITVQGRHVSSVQKGATFGELALVYNCPRTATITCSQAGRLWALDRMTFRRLVARNQADQIDECRNALRKVALLKPLTDAQLSQLAEAAQIVLFDKGKRIINKGDRGNVLYIIKSGSVICSDAGDAESLRLTDSDYFGERALMTHEPRAANVTAETNVALIALDRQAFDDLLGSLREVIDHNMSMRVLQSIPLLKNISRSEQDKLFQALEPVSFQDGEFVIREGEAGTTFYIIKSGSATVKKSVEGAKPPTKRQIATLSSGNYFGEMSLLRNEPRQADVIANGPLECLSLDQAKFVELLGPLQDVLNREADQRTHELTLRDVIPMAELEFLRTLGCGTFGRVKLVRHKSTALPYAMKVLSKANVVAYKQQSNVLNEKRIMAQCNHPFILKLFQTYKDKTHLYLLVEFVQGGELFSYLHCTPNSPGRLVNNHARFYASHVLMALEYLHERHIVYRDLKPENLLIDPEGYLKVVDFGFAKVVTDRTYTLCGTPEYLAPELVLGKGHNKGVDYWALGVLIFEMVVGYSPFAGANQADQMQICQNIVRQTLEFPTCVSEPCRDLISKLLDRDQAKRLGLTHGGAQAIRSHAWFSGLNWDRVYKKQEPAPYKPKLANPLDASQFDIIADGDDKGTSYTDDGSDWDKDF